MRIEVLLVPDFLLLLMRDAIHRKNLYGARGGTRTLMPFGMRPLNARVCHFTTRAQLEDGSEKMNHLKPSQGSVDDISSFFFRKR